MSLDDSLCRCGHGLRLHRHYRAGTDCARCVCHRFRPDYRQALQLLRFVAVLRWWALRRILLRFTRCLLFGHHAKFDSYPHCLLCGKRVDRDHTE